MSERESACPEPAALVEYHEGRLIGEALSRVAEHLEVCTACSAELAVLDHSLTGELRDLLPGGPEEPSPAETEVRKVDTEYEALVALLRESAEGERYEVLGELGRGGMGVVYEVRDRVLQRSLAMKVAGAGGRRSSGAASPTGHRLARFLEEVRITGQLDHPSIIPVHELGIDVGGRAFFTMRKVRGLNLHDVLDEFERGEGDWTLQGLVGVLHHVCDTVAYAHSRRIVHRDLKPANIMAGRYGAVYVLDWGVAKLMPREGRGPREPTPEPEQESSVWSVRAEGHEGDSSTPLLTLDGDVLGTPPYMAPEQALGLQDMVDPRADVYSMGAILYRLLSGRTPFDEGGEKPTPHSAWKRLLDGPPAPLAEVAPNAPDELVAVCERAMARDPRARYPEMAALSSELTAWLEGRVVRAYKTGVAVEIRKWIARNRALASAILIALAASVGLSGSLVQHSVVEARMLRTERLIELKRSNDPAASLRLAIEVADSKLDYRARTQVLASLRHLSLDAVLHRPTSQPTTHWSAEGSRGAWSPEGDLFVFGERQHRDGPVRIRIWNVKERRFEETSFVVPSTEVYIFHPDGNQIASGGADGSVWIHDLRKISSRQLVDDEGGRAHTDVVARLAFDPCGSLLASASWDGSIRLWDVAMGTPKQTLGGHAGIVTSIEFDETGKHLLSASGPPTPGYSSDNTARVWDVATGECLYSLEHDGPVTSARFDPTGKFVLSTSYDTTAQLWRAGDGEWLRKIPLAAKVWDGAFSPVGSRLAVAFDPGFLVQDVEPRREYPRVNEYRAHDGRAVTDVEFSPCGNRLLTTGNDAAGRVWDLVPGDLPQLALRVGRGKKMLFGSWSPDGSRIATAWSGGTCLWFADGNPTIDGERPTGTAATRARFDPAEDRVVLTFEGEPAVEYAFARGEGLSSPHNLGDAPARDVAISRDGKWTLVAEEGGPLRLWRRGESESRVLDLDAKSLHPSGEHDFVGVILVRGGAAVIDCSGEPEVLGPFAEEDSVSAIDIFEPGGRVALGTAKGILRVVDSTGKPVYWETELEKETTTQTGVFAVSFYDEGHHLISAGPQVGWKVWDVETGREREDIRKGGTVGGVFVLGDGKRMLIHEKWNSPVRLTEPSGIHRASLSGPDGYAHLNRVTAWSLDEEQRRLLTTSLDRTATIWDLERAEPWVTFAEHDAPILAGDLTRDGEWAVTADAEGRVYVWPTNPLEPARAALPKVMRPQ